MKKIILFSILIFSLSSFSQKDPNVYDFFGGKSFGNETVFFRLVFQIEAENISGYMYTDEQGDGETKSVITGKINKKTNRIFFTETRKLLSKTNTGFNALCYVNGNITLDLSPKFSKLKGSYIEQTAAGKKCQNGTISLISPDAYFKLKKQEEIAKAIAKKNKVTKEKIVVQNTKVVVPTFSSDKKTTIKDDEEVVIYWISDKIKLSIWDDQKEDGDEISIRFNDEEILDHYFLRNKKKEIELDLVDGENKLIFTADSTGFISNNTARVDLFDAELKHQIITQLQLNKSVTVIIKKQ